jgi:hypothetical protein
MVGFPSFDTGCLSEQFFSTGRLIREFKDSHTSHIFDVKFDARRIVRSVAVFLSFAVGILCSLFFGLDSVRHTTARLSCWISPLRWVWTLLYLFEFPFTQQHNSDHWI